MKSEIFDEKYAKLYDLMYSSEKNYKHEVDFLEKLFDKYAERPVLKVLDLACGTGNHSIELAKRGYDVTSVDFSESMLEIARFKALKEKVDIDFHVAAMQNFEIQEKVDVVICMFAAFDYLIKLKDIQDTLENVYKYLNNDGLLIIDFWNKDQFLTHAELKRQKEIYHDNIKFQRVSDIDHNRLENILNIKIKCILSENGKIIQEFNELHKMRYFDIDEISDIMHNNKFDILKICPFMKLDEDIKDPWVLNLIAKKTKE